jgi:glycyl-tRNA synthetase
MSKPLSFQQMILKFLSFWADYGCIIWQPYNVQVGAGTMNPATVLRVLGPEPWNVAYIEPSVRPDDGRFGDNPNRMQLHYQLQVILQPDPGNPQELYLDSLEAIGIDRRRHDIRFVEDNWESPAMGAWGLGWEVWLDGQEITQFTYFQQAGGFDLDPVAVELTYGLERILIALQGKGSVWDMEWGMGITYGDVLLRSEIEHCEYYFNIADVDALRKVYDTYEAEAQRALDAGLVLPAHDYNLKCSHLFNVLDTRGAIGVTERATYFHRMREMARKISAVYLEQRQRFEYPFMDVQRWQDLGTVQRTAVAPRPIPLLTTAAPFLFEIGTEELPADDVASALAQLESAVPQLLSDLRLEHGEVQVVGTPRRLVVLVEALAPRQTDRVEEIKGPPADRAYDAEGNPTQAAMGFARRHNMPVESLGRMAVEDKQYVTAQVREAGRPAAAVLSEALPQLIGSLWFAKSMRWRPGNPIAFSRPIRWLVALHGDQVIPLEYADVLSGRMSRGLRPDRSPEIEIGHASLYRELLGAAWVMVDPAERRAETIRQVDELASKVGGRALYVPGLLDEVNNLVEQPTALLGSYDQGYLNLPRDVLVTVMRKHQRYFPVTTNDGQLMPYFIAVCNGDLDHLDIVRAGNEHVIRARFADAEFFYSMDTRQPLADLVPRLDTLTFETSLGSMLDKTHRLEKLVAKVGEMLALEKDELATVRRAATLAKADLVTHMVVEMTSLQGIMGREYARLSGEAEPVAQAIYEHYLPRSQGDALPETRPGMALGIADRLDSLVGLFAAGLTPTGSADPYGLRRAALGIVQALIGANQRFSLSRELVAAAELLPIDVRPGLVEEVYDFILGRLRVMLREEGFRYDVVEAVLMERGDDPAAARQAIIQLSRWVERTDWSDLLNAYGRCKRMARRYDVPYGLDFDAFVEPAAQEMSRAYLSAAARVAPNSSVDAFLEVLQSLISPINRFFEDVLVDDDEHPEWRDNRRALVQHITELADGILDFTQLEGF